MKSDNVVLFDASSYREPVIVRETFLGWTSTKAQTFFLVADVKNSASAAGILLRYLLCRVYDP